MGEFSPTDPSASAEPRTKAECAELITEVWTLLDGDCTPKKREKLKRHLDECPPCLRLFGLEEQFKALLATKCSCEKAPEGLRERLRLEIRRTTIIRDLQS
ncbi:mycothiol system anti-sigma-R factor [Mycobacterium tilburgii]|uniref:mycothiol system anti-sigma-R factor n=1 Tax=Mycobacterium tilburgii TaxID=44467 RepID=UPI0011835C88|nr:mycothiol system anti-sigma-R factor [Mycobacterium tilburgii]